MAIINTVTSAIPPEYQTVLLMAALVVAFIIAFKIMSMVFETMLVAVLSAAFYGVFTYMFYNTMPGLNNLLLFSFLGATLYMGYTFLESAFKLVTTLAKIPIKIIKIAMSILEKAFSGARKMIPDRSSPKKKSSGGEKDVKEVVLDKVQKENEDEEN